MNDRQKRLFYKWLKIFLIFEFVGIGIILSVYYVLDSKGMFFLYPKFLLPLVLLPLLYLVFFKRLHSKIIFFEIITNSLINKQKDEFSVYTVHFILLKNIVIVLLIALSSPIYGTKEVHVISKDAEIMVCLDISNSMNVRDINGESRLEVSKRVLNSIINKLSGQKIGICLFAADPFIQVPPTTDYESLKHLLSEVQTTYLSNQGTNVNSALEKTLTTFSENKIPKTLILITDGENHDFEKSTVYSSIKSRGIGLFALGIGTETGGPVPDLMSNSLKISNNGEMVISKVNSEFVQQIASESDGKFLMIKTPYPDPKSLLTEINLRSKGYYRNLKVEIQKALYVYPIFCAFVLFIIYMLYPFRKLLKK